MTSADPSGALCGFPTRKYTRSIADHYVSWTNEAEREAYLVDYLPVMGLKRSANKEPLATLQAAVDELFPSIRAELPAETEGMITPPTVVLLDDAATNAFAANDPRESPARAPWLLFVNQGLVDLRAPEAEVRGVMAHELAHLMAKHQFPDAPARVRRYYSVGGRSEGSVVASLANDDAKVRAFAERFESLVAYGGAFDVPAAKGFTLKFSGLTRPIRYHRFFETMGQLPTTECDGFGTKYAGMQEALRRHLSKFDHQVHIEGADVAAMESTASATAEAARACAASGSVTLVDLAVQLELTMHPERQAELQAALAKSPDDLRRAVLDADEIAADDKDTDVVTKLLALGTTKRQALAKHVASTEGADDLRRYAEEVEADQIAIRVLRHAFPDAEPTSGANFLLRSLNENERAQCDAVLAAGEVPPFGGFSFLHPAACWRVFEARTFATQLATSCDAK